MKHSSLQKYLGRVFRILGAQDNMVNLEIISNNSVLAGAQGANISKIVFGRIFISKGLINLLNSDELKFVLIHEATHVYMNHLPMKIMGKSVRELVLNLGYKNPIIFSSVLLADMINLMRYRFGSLPPEAKLTREQELQADMWGVIILGDEEVAISCLKKIVGYDLDKPSHLWEALGIGLPIMTMRERIREIRKRASILRKEDII